MHPELETLEVKTAALRQSNAAARESRRKRKRVIGGAVMALGALTLGIAVTAIVGDRQFGYPLLAAGTSNFVIGALLWSTHSSKRAL
jgi:hypothetical protein